MRGLQDAAANDGSFAADFRVLWPDGSLHWIALRCRRIEQGYLAGTCTEVTERKQIEHALAESESRLRLAIGGARLGLFTRDLKTRRLHLDERGAEIVGEAPGYLDYEDWISLIHVEDRQRVADLLQNPISANVEYRIEYRLCRKDGTLRWIRALGAAEPGPDGFPVQVTGVIQDITERRVAEQAIRESEEQFRTLANSIPHLAWMASADGYVFWYNQRWYDYTGTTLEQMQGWGWQSVHDERELPRVLDRWHHSIATGEPFDMTFPIRGRDGFFRPFLTRVMPVKDRAGRVVRWFGTNTDITERTQIEELLRHSEERYRRLYDSNIVGIICARGDQIIEANDVFLNMIGYTRQELHEGRINWRQLTPPEFQDISDRAARELFSSGLCKPFEKEYLRKDRTRIPVLLGATLLERNPAEWLCIVLDLSERKELDRRLLEKQKLESIGLLAGGIAHDFNNLLVGLLGYSSLALELLPKTNPAAGYVEEVMRAADRAAHLTRQMLAYSGQGQFVIEQLVLPETMREVIDLVRASVSRNVDIRVDLPPDVPHIFGDRGQVRQLLTNLLLNACEAIGETPGIVIVQAARREIGINGAPAEFAGTMLEPGEYLWIAVTDSGCGMGEDVQARMFEPFFTTKFTGRGLGLAAVSGVVRSHKGAIRVTSAPGEGSTFEVLLPSTANLSLPEQPDDTPEVSRNTVLVIDDEELVRRTARVSLERRGFSVFLAENGLTALKILEQNEGRIQVAVLDLSMPGMSGREVLPRLRQLHPKLKVLLSSGYSREEAMKLFSDQPIDGFIQKPYTASRLATAVESALLTPE
jgi:PAS domain S-box-containing protein